MTQLEKVLYTAKAHTTGGRDGASRSSDGRLDVMLSSPGVAGNGTNPEQRQDEGLPQEQSKSGRPMFGNSFPAHR